MFYDYALFHDDFGGALAEEPVASARSRDDGAHRLSHRVEGVHSGERLLWDLVANRLVALAHRSHKTQQSALRLVAHLLWKPVWLGGLQTRFPIKTNAF